MSVILSLDSVSKYFGSEPVLDRISLDIRAGEHLALIGPNGAGKTTLLTILIGELEPDRGSVNINKSTSVGILRQRHEQLNQQTVWESARQAMEPILRMIEQADQLAYQIAQTDDETRRLAWSRQFDRLQTEINYRDGYQLDHQIRRVLDGLGFAESEYQKPVNQLSGGQLNRLMLARMLLEAPTLMLLDEPSNHLDIAATQWLEEFLKGSKQAFLLVSHDRYFLDQVSQQTLELVHARIDRYSGNYTKYRMLKEQRLQVERSTYEKQQLEVEKLQDFIRRNHYGLKHAQAEDRRKKLERIELVEPPREIHSPPMKFAQPKRTGDIVLRVEGLGKSFNSITLFDQLTFQIERGQRWGILGPNGCGKSSLLKCLLKQMPPDRGTVTIGEGVQIGYFDQHLSGIDDEQIVADAIRPGHKQMIDQQRRDLLARFGVTGEMALQTVRSLSGGERNRVALAFLAAQDANFLLLDEPTNHLDLWARQSLEAALLDFEGTLLMVSHDRYFIRELCDHLIVFEPHRVYVFENNYETYLQEAQAVAQTEMKVESRNDPKRRLAKNNLAKRKRQFPYRKLETIESEIAATESRVEELHFELANPAVLRDEAQIKLVKSELADLSDTLKTLYLHWEEAIELN